MEARKYPHAPPAPANLDCVWSSPSSRIYCWSTTASEQEQSRSALPRSEVENSVSPERGRMYFIPEIFHIPLTESDSTACHAAWNFMYSQMRLTGTLQNITLTPP